MSDSEIIILVIIVFTSIVLVSISYRLSKAIYFRKAITALFSGLHIPVHFEMLPKKLPARYHNFLNTGFPFYRNLAAIEKRVFGSRVMKLIASKSFQTRENLDLTYEMKLIIAATSVKISFGLKDYYLDTFHTIILYPGEFFSRFSKAMVKGETNGSGVIVFSWKDLQFGFDVDDDALNLAYHELAHAIFIDHFKKRSDDSFTLNYIKWLRFVRNRNKLLEVKQKQIFRKYATYNEQEFFAVAMENFFEKPENFKKELPNLYLLMSAMLNQDPLQKTKHYSRSSH